VFPEFDPIAEIFEVPNAIIQPVVLHRAGRRDNTEQLTGTQAGRLQQLWHIFPFSLNFAYKKSHSDFL
jgi:hypothetical protein